MFKLIASLCFGLLASISNSTAATVFYYTSTPGSWVGGGETRTIKPTTNFGFDFTATRNFDNGVSLSINDFATNPDRTNLWWFLDFAAPGNADLAEGLYLGATRFPFQALDEPGLTMAGNGRGNNMQTGYFNVLEYVTDLNEDVVSFAADFLQYDELQTVFYTWGSIRFNSDFDVTLNPVLNPIPIPPAGVLFAAALLAFGRRFRFDKTSVSVS